jgi:Na+-translocating ferredoxin:NAD+ oxidoreductase subunit B
MRFAKPLSNIDLTNLIQAIDAVLPQTQCRRCEYEACQPYAEAVAKQEVPINRCEPGGKEVIAQIAQLMQQEILPPFHPPRSIQVALIREEDCIGCARCLPACPVDAIVGARRWMHTVITQDCTGCDLCLKSCPVDCIEIVDPPEQWSLPDPNLSRQRYQDHLARQNERRTKRIQLQDRAQRRLAMIASARAAMEARRKKAS